jgi:hypothetical protein
MATKTDRRQGGWSEYSYRSEVHGGTGYYWQRDADGLRVSMRQSGCYYPPGEAVKLGRMPRARYAEADEVPGQVSGNMYDPVDLSELVLANMRTQYEGAHVRFAYNGQLMHTIGESDFEANGIELHGDGYPSMEAIISYAARIWPVGDKSKWPKSLGVPADLS